jgi:hypothetical protein
MQRSLSLAYRHSESRFSKPGGEEKMFEVAARFDYSILYLFSEEESDSGIAEDEEQTESGLDGSDTRSRHKSPSGDVVLDLLEERCNLHNCNSFFYFIRQLEAEANRLGHEILSATLELAMDACLIERQRSLVIYTLEKQKSSDAQRDRLDPQEDSRMFGPGGVAQRILRDAISALTPISERGLQLPDCEIQGRRLIDLRSENTSLVTADERKAAGHWS